MGSFGDPRLRAAELVDRQNRNDRRSEISLFNLRRLRAKLSSSTKATLSPEDRQEIANELKVEISDVEAMEVRLGSLDQSLNMAVGEEGGEEWQNFLEDERASPEQVVIGMRDSETRSAWLAEAMAASRIASSGSFASGAWSSRVRP